MPYIYGDEGDNILNGTNDGDSIFGYGGNDTLYGYEGYDYLYGGPGDDVLDGGAGSDWVDFTSSANGVTVNLLTGTATGDGNDTLISIEQVWGSWYDDTIVGNDELNFIRSSLGNDTIDAGGGNDIIRFTYGDVMIDGGSGEDILSLRDAGSFLGYGIILDAGDLPTGAFTVAGTITASNIEIIEGSGYRDIFVAGEEAVIFLGVEGDDSLYGGAGNDLLSGDGSILFYFSTEAEIGTFVDDTGQYAGAVGNDQLFGGAGDDSLFGGPGDDELHPGPGSDTVVGGDGSDTLSYDHIWSGDPSGLGVWIDLSSQSTSWAASQDTISGIENVEGTAFADVLKGDANNNQLIGDAGDDILKGYAGGDHLLGGDGEDILKGGSGKDALDGGSNDDILRGNGGKDIAEGGSGIDQIFGGGGTDTLSGGAGADTIAGGGAGDQLFGDEGADTLFGDGGNDWLDGGFGDDGMTGGFGSDLYYFNDGYGDDTILDFEAGETIAFDASMGLSFGDLVIDTQGDMSVITWGTDDSITVFGDAAASISEGDFWFGAADPQAPAMVAKEPLAEIAQLTDFRPYEAKFEHGLDVQMVDEGLPVA